MSRLPATLLCVSGAVLLCGNTAPVTQFTGAWWQAQPEGVQFAFMEGEADCYISLAHPDMRPDDADTVARQAVSDYIRTHQEARAWPLLNIFRTTTRLHQRTSADDGGEGSGEQHGVLDGTIWAGLNHQERLAYTDGYLVCRTAYLRRPPRQSVARIEHDISVWYGLDGKFVSPEGDLPDADESKEADKIGALIDRFG